MNVYVGTDEKLHFVDRTGADSVLPFSKGTADYSLIELWRNSNLKANFSPQSVNIDASNYVYLVIEVNESTTNQSSKGFGLFGLVDKSIKNPMIGCGATRREISSATETIVKFGNGRNWDNYDIINVYGIPVAIYGLGLRN